MTDFWIGFDDDTALSDDPLVSYGFIRIGEHQERLEIDLCHWRRPDYERHWWEAVARLVTGGEASRHIGDDARGDAERQPIGRAVAAQPILQALAVQQLHDDEIDPLP